MAQFINFPVVNGFIGGGAAAPQLDGDNLVQIAQISTFTIATANAGAGTSQTDITFNLAGLPAGSDVVTVTVASNSGSSDPQGNAPFIGANTAAGSTAYNVRLKSAIIAAMCANPGGVKSTVTLPQSSVANAAYLQGNSVYFKNIAVG